MPSRVDGLKLALFVNGALDINYAVWISYTASFFSGG
jgi:hypothetical protein